MVAFSQSMIDDTSVVTIVNFLETLELHDESEALAEFENIPVSVVCGDEDWIIPFASSEALAQALPRSETVRVRQGGHLVQLEFPEQVNGAILRLVTRATEAAGKKRRWGVV